MKDKSMTDSSFFAKMLLLFALVFFGHPQKRKGLELYIKTFAAHNPSTVGQVHAPRMTAGQAIPAAVRR